MGSLDRNADDNQYTLLSVGKALKILDLYYQRRELGPGDVASLMDMTRSAAFRMLTTLSQNGYLSKTENGRYRLGLKLFSLGQLAYSHAELVSYARPHLLVLAERCCETAHLSVMDGYDGIIFLEKAFPQSPLHMNADIGHRYRAHLTASGKAILAFQPKDIIGKYIESCDFVRITESSIAEKETLIEVLKQIRIKHWSADYEECIPGLTCLAAPILDRAGRSVGAISISGATTRMQSNWEEKIRLVVSAAETISSMIH